MDSTRTGGVSRSGSTLERAIEADIRAELESHLALAQDELIASGSDEESAQELALERFGNFERTVRACRRQKLKEKIMLQRLQFTATLALLVAVAYFGVRAERLAKLLEPMTAQAEVEQPRVLGEVSYEPLAPTPVIVEFGDSIQVLSSSSYGLAATESLASDGTVLLRMIGHVQVLGKTRGEVEELLRHKYAAYYDDDLNLFVKVYKHPKGR